MSSSRVIKSSGQVAGAITEFNYRGFVEQAAVDETIPHENGFVPFAGVKFADVPQISQALFGEEADKAPEDARVAEMELQLRVSEEEAMERVREAYEKGLEEGQRLAERGLSNVFKALRESVEEVAALRERIFRESEGDLLKLSILVAGTIIRQEIAHDRRILAKVVATALENYNEHDEVVIRLNPDDYKLVSSHKNVYLPGTGDRKAFNLKPDESVSAGGCIVDTVMGEVDARLETQLEEIYKHLLEERGEIIGLPGNFRNDREQYAYEEN